MDEQGIFSPTSFLTNITLIARSVHVPGFDMVGDSLLLLGLVSTDTAAVGARFERGDILLCLLLQRLVSHRLHMKTCDRPWLIGGSGIFYYRYLV